MTIDSNMPPRQVPARLAIVLLFAVALVARIAAALAIEHRNRQAGREHDFPDSELYWKLALNIAAGRPYNDGKRAVLRTPGYPLFLAASIRAFGPSLVGARQLQASVGAASCVLLFLLIRKLLDPRAAAIAAGVAAVYPHAVLLSVVLLSEALFTPLLLVQLLLLSELLERLRSGDLRPVIGWSVAVGAAAAATTLVRPSWILIAPLAAVLLAIVRFSPPAGDRTAERTVAASPRSRRIAAVCLMAGFVAGMAPWWIRNWQVTGHFVSTTLWVGASLYDGLNERADGSSRMDFLDRPAAFGLDSDIGHMGEWEQDQYLRRAAVAHAVDHPIHVLELAVAKFLRFWNPMLNAAGATPAMKFLSLLASGPVLALAAAGAWRLRRRWDVLALLAGPVLYFCLIHLVFVSSVRYREAAMLPVLGLVAAAGRRTIQNNTPPTSDPIQ